MTQDNVEIVIVPGSFSTTPPYDVLIKAFNASGYSARVVGLLSANDGTRLPPATMQDDAAEIRSAVQSILDDPQHPRNVVVIGHSYGGLPATEAVKGFSRADRAGEGKNTGVVALVYIAAFIPDEGQCLRDLQSKDVPEEFKHPSPGIYYPVMAPEFAPWVYNDVADPEEQKRLHATFTRHSADSFDGKVSYAAWKDIPSLQVLPSMDIVIPVEIQQAMFETAKAAAPGKITQVRYEGAGHCYCLHGTGPERTVAEVVKLVEANL